MRRCMPNKGNLLDETNGIHPRTANSIKEERFVRKGLGRRLSKQQGSY